MMYVKIALEMACKAFWVLFLFDFCKKIGDFAKFTIFYYFLLLFLCYAKKEEGRDLNF